MKGLSNSFRYTYNKLVRDRIPENIDSEPGRKSQYRILDDTVISNVCLLKEDRVFYRTI